MITLIKNSSYKESLWKNGLGRTHQIAIFPEHATISNNDFLWRLSLAKVSQPETFSTFPNCDRQLIVWKGEGLLLNGSLLLPNTPLAFSGEQKINCDLINHIPVVDFGVIHQTGLIDISLEILQITQSTSLDCNQGIHFLFLALGNEFLIDGLSMSNGDCLRIENEIKPLAFSQSDPTFLFYHVKILIK